MLFTALMENQVIDVEDDVAGALGSFNSDEDLKSAESSASVTTIIIDIDSESDVEAPSPEPDEVEEAIDGVEILAGSYDAQKAGGSKEDPVIL
jgi:hypothetical protein